MPGLVPGTYVFVAVGKLEDVDGRAKPGHEGQESSPRIRRGVGGQEIGAPTQRDEPADKLSFAFEPKPPSAATERKEAELVE